MMMLDWFGAFDDFNTICEELDKDFAPAYASRAEARMQLGLNNEKAPQRKEALIDVDKAIRLNKSLGYAYAVKGWILAHREEGSPDPSRDVDDAFRKAKEFSPTDPEVLLLRGDAFACLNKTDEVERTLGEALHYATKGSEESAVGEQYDENRYLAARGLIDCRNKANLPGATDALTKLPQGDSFYRPLLEGEIAAARGDYKRAADQYEVFLRSSPHASSVYVKMADCYVKQGGKLNIDVAETRATEGLQSCSKSAALYAKRGEIRAALTHYDDAVADFDMALKFNSEHQQAKTQRADSLQKADAARGPKKSDSVKDKL
jgi:tetratricopeptide (TPR) repeat protein